MLIRFVFTVLLLAAIGCTTGGTCAPPSAGNDLRVMSFNVRTSTAADGPDAWTYRKEFLLQTIRAYDPDLLGTQEVQPGQYDFLVERMPDYTPVGVGRDDGKRKGEFSLILVRKARFTVLDSGTFWLSERPDVPGSKSWDTEITRICTYAVVKDATTNRELLFANTHFDHRGREARRRSGEMLAQKLPAIADGRPIILAGDFNCHETDPPYLALTANRALLDSYRLVHPTPGDDEASFNGFKPVTRGKRIDFIFHTPDFHPTAAAIDRTKSPEGRFPSDHYPVTATLRLRPANRPVSGADQTDQYVPYLEGKRVAMVANQTSIIRGRPGVDVLLASGVRVVKVFGPEHGFRGNASNGTPLADEIDEKTGLPIISLYGPKRKPSREDLSDVDVVLFDLQDMGVRFYTKINTLRNVMEACAEHDVEMLLLDRPNPHAYMVDGPILDMNLKSGIGQFPIPIAHGMTIGEFAGMINGEGWLPGGRRCRVKVVKIANYTHDTPYVLPVKPSPNLNTPQSVMLYPSTCLFEGTILNHGRGTQYPFTVIGAPALAGKYEFSYTPVGIPGMAEDPVHQDQVCYGLDFRNYDVEQLRRERRINLSWIKELYAAYPDKERFFDQSYHRQIGNIDKLAGTSEFRRQIIAGVPEEEIRRSWEPGLSKFKAMRQKYLLYP